MYQIVENYIDKLVQEFDLIPSERKEILDYECKNNELHRT